MTYLSHFRVQHVVEGGILLLVVLLPLLTHAGVFERLQTWFGTETNAQQVVSTEPSHTPDAGYLQGALNSDPEAARGGGGLYMDEGVLVASGPVGEDEIATTGVTSGEISVYTVRSGDSLSQIAEMYNVTSNTVLWANDLSGPTDIRPGDTLVILPIAGVQHTIASGDTVASIANEYDGDVDEILAYNRLSGDSDLEVGEDIVVPGGQIEAAPEPETQSAPSRPAPTRESGSSGAASGGLTHPAPGTVRTQGLHGYNAVDFGGSIGSPIRAAAAGEVIVSRNSGWNGGYGNYMVIRHPNGTQTLYAHNNRNYVGVGEYVTAGQTIGEIGNTGRSTGPHLHFEVRGSRNPF